MSEEGEFQSSFNMAVGLTSQIDSLLRGASEQYIRGNIHEAWKRMKAVHNRITQLLHESEQDEKESKELKELSNYVCNISKQTQGDISPNQFELRQKQINLATKLYDDYNNLLMSVLQRKGLLLQGKKDSVHMKW